MPLAAGFHNSFVSFVRSRWSHKVAMSTNNSRWALNNSQSRHHWHYINKQSAVESWGVQGAGGLSANAVNRGHKTKRQKILYPKTVCWNDVCPKYNILMQPSGSQSLNFSTTFIATTTTSTKVLRVSAIKCCKSNNKFSSYVNCALSQSASAHYHPPPSSSNYCS